MGKRTEVDCATHLGAKKVRGSPLIPRTELMRGSGAPWPTLTRCSGGSGPDSGSPPGQEKPLRGRRSNFPTTAEHLATQGVHSGSLQTGLGPPSRWGPGSEGFQPVPDRQIPAPGHQNRSYAPRSIFPEALARSYPLGKWFGSV